VKICFFFNEMYTYFKFFHIFHIFHIYIYIYTKYVYVHVKICMYDSCIYTYGVATVSRID